MDSKRNIKLLAIFNFLDDFDLLGPVAAIYFAQVTGNFTKGMSIFAILMVSAVSSTELGIPLPAIF